MGQALPGPPLDPPLWIGGRIIQVTGPVSYVIELDNGNIVRRHVEHIKKKFTETYLY